MISSWLGKVNDIEAGSTPELKCDLFAGKSWSLDEVANLNNIWDVKGVVESYYANHGVSVGLLYHYEPV